MNLMKAILMFVAVFGFVLQVGCSSGSKEAKPPAQFTPPSEDPSFSTGNGESFEL